MKSKIAVIVGFLLLSVPCNAVSDTVTLVNAFTNQHEVLVVEVQGRSALYTITCNADQDTCKIPNKGVSYFLGDTNNKLYTCQNVALYFNGQQYGIYCFRGVQ